MNYTVDLKEKTITINNRIEVNELSYLIDKYSDFELVPILVENTEFAPHNPPQYFNPINPLYPYC